MKIVVVRKAVTAAFKTFSTIVISLFVLVGVQPNAEASKKDLLIRAAIGQNIHGFGRFDIDEPSYFDKNSKEILWFGVFKFLSANQAHLKIIWLTPSGETFKREVFSTQFSNCDFGWAKLEVQGKDSAAVKLEGQWSVKVYWDDDLIDERTFNMGAPVFSSRPIKAPQDSSATADGYIRLAKAFFAKNDLSMAAEKMLLAQNLEPNRPDVALILATIYNAQGKPEDAILQFTKAEKLNANSADVHRGLGASYLKMGLISEAVVEYEKVVAEAGASADDKKLLNELKSKKQ